VSYGLQPDSVHARCFRDQTAPCGTQDQAALVKTDALRAT
jgi:hypothetical protein